MYCCKCGSEISEAFQFCPHCGARVLTVPDADGKKEPSADGCTTRPVQQQPTTEVDPTAIPVIPVYLQQRQKKTVPCEVPAVPASPNAPLPSSGQEDGASPQDPSFPDRPLFEKQGFAPVYTPMPSLPQTGHTAKPRYTSFQIAAAVLYGLTVLLGLIYMSTSESLLLSWEYAVVTACAVLGLVFCLVLRQPRSRLFFLPAILYFLVCCYAPLNYLIQGYHLTLWVTARFCLNVLSILLLLLFCAFPRRNRAGLFIYLLVQAACILAFNLNDLFQFAGAMIISGRIGELLRIVCTDLMDYLMILAAAFSLFACQKRQTNHTVPLPADGSADPESVPAVNHEPSQPGK